MRFTVNLSDAAVKRIDEQAKREGRSRANMIKVMLGDIDPLAHEPLANPPTAIAQLEAAIEIPATVGQVVSEQLPVRFAQREPARRIGPAFGGPLPKPKDRKR